MGNLKRKGKVVIFTDLDDTLLDRNYQFREVEVTIKVLNQKKIPIIFCSAKTKAEQEIFRKKLRINHPFIVENGSAIYIPPSYFGGKKGKIKGKYEVIVLGEESKKILAQIKKLKKSYKIKGYADLSFRKVSKITGLTLKFAKLAKKREYGETIVEAEKKALQKLKKKYNVVSGGRFIQVYGKEADKGKAVKILTRLYQEKFKKVFTLGIGNAENDLPMLKAVLKPALVKNVDGTWAKLKLKNLYKAKNIGPKGWVEVIKRFVLKS